MPKKHSDGDVRYEVIPYADVETGDTIIPLPLPLLKSLGWKEGDDIEVDINEDGQLFLKKSNK